MIALPDKPRYRQPCNGCGLCCALEMCPVAEMAYPNHLPPCPALKLNEARTRTYCAIAATEAKNEMEPMIQKALGIGEGCTMPDEN